MKVRNLAAMLMVSVSMLTACQGTPQLPDEPYESVDSQLYPSPEGAYVGDTMPFVTEDGTLELYYLYDTDHNGQGYHPIYRYSTKDFCTYQDDGMMLNFGVMSDPDPAIGTGSVMQDQNGLYHMFYTGHNDLGNGGKGKECVMHATSTDRNNWTKIPEDVFYSPEEYSKDDFRDPEVFWLEEEQCYWLLIAARNDKEEGVVLKYISDDLKKWTCCGSIFSPHKQYMLECPDIIHLGKYYYLTYSWDCVTYYAMSDSINGPYHAPEDNVLDGTGFVFYAAKTVTFKDKPYLCGWLGRAGLTVDSGIYQWAGSVLNHQIVQKEDGSLGVKAPDTFDDYFSKEKEFQAAKKEGNVKIKGNAVSLSASGEEGYSLCDLGTRPASMRLDCDVTIDKDACAGFAFGGSEEDESFTALCLDSKENMLHYEGTKLDELSKSEPKTYTKFEFSKESTHHVTLICENEVVVLYIDDAKVLSSRIYHSINGAHIGLFSTGGNAAFNNVLVTLPSDD